MIPAKTIDKLGVSTIAGIVQRAGYDAHEDFMIEGCELTELTVLATRMNHRFDDPNELRDWQNRLNLLVDSCKRRRVE